MVLEWILFIVMCFLLGWNLGEAHWNYRHKITDLPALIVAIALLMIFLYIGFGYLFN